MKILDPSTRVAVWELKVFIQTAGSQKKRDKNFDETLHGIVQDFAALTNKH